MIILKGAAMWGLTPDGQEHVYSSYCHLPKFPRFKKGGGVMNDKRY
jgi:hypothetical protein